MGSEVEQRFALASESEPISHTIEAAFNVVVQHNSSNPPGDALCLVVIGKRLLTLCFIELPLRHPLTVDILGIPVSDIVRGDVSDIVRESYTNVSFRVSAW